MRTQDLHFGMNMVAILYFEPTTKTLTIFLTHLNFNLKYSCAISKLGTEVKNLMGKRINNL